MRSAQPQKSLANMGKYILSNQKEGKIAAERFLVPVMFYKSVSMPSVAFGFFSCLIDVSVLLRSCFTVNKSAGVA